MKKPLLVLSVAIGSVFQVLHAQTTVINGLTVNYSDYKLGIPVDSIFMFMNTSGFNSWKVLEAIS